MNTQSCSHSEAELRVLEVFRRLHPEWVDASGGCQACLLYSMELAAGTALAAQPQPESAAAGSAATDLAGATPPSMAPVDARSGTPSPP
jgi:hypothetical protein